MLKTVHGPQKGALPGTRGADDEDDLPFRDTERYAAKGFYFPKVLYDVFYPYNSFFLFKSIQLIIELGETEKTIMLLASEIESTKRRVNALEHIIIPRLQNTVKYIEMRLEEMERESFVRLKMVKKSMESEEAVNG